PPLLRAAGARAFDEDLTHRSCGDADEVALVVPRRAGVRESDVGLVDERRRLQRLAGAFTAHVTGRDAAQLVVHERGERVGVGRGSGHFAYPSKVVVIVMGVAGSGKTVIGRALAATLGWRFVDADDYHSKENIAKMRSGQALTDADRAPWLAALHALVARTLD